MQAPYVNTRGADNMWRCVVLLSICCVGLAAGQLGLGLFGDDLYSQHAACGPNEYFEQCTHDCPPEKTCETRKFNINCPAVVTPCIARCICKEGYYRKSPGGECISEEECGPACGEGEEYKDCTNPCIDESCDAMGSLIPNCTAPEPCEPGCACKEGFYKLYNFICVPKCYCRQLRDTPECKN